MTEEVCLQLAVSAQLTYNARFGQGTHDQAEVCPLFQRRRSLQIGKYLLQGKP